jgi:hypothetical protein
MVHRFPLLAGFLLVFALHLGCTPVPEGSSADNTLVFRDSRKKIRVIGLENDGKLKFSTFEGPQVTVVTTVILVDLIPGKSESFRSEDEHAWFRVEPGQSLPTFPKLQFIQLWFDRRDLFPPPFVAGEKWEFVLTETGELVDRRPLKTTR